MAYNVKEIVANKPSRFTEGHRMCAGCELLLLQEWL